MKGLARLSIVTAALALACAAPAAADTTLGSSAPPSGSAPNDCADSLNIVLQYTENSSTPYFVPGPGKITSWQTNTLGSVAGASLTFVVLKPLTSTSWSVVGTDPRTLPTPLPPGNVASFTLATPISVSGGETLGLLGSTSTVCYFENGTVPLGSSLDVAAAPTPPAAGQALAQGTMGPSPPAFTLNLAANFAPMPVPATPAPVPTHHKKCKKKRRHAVAAKRHCKKKRHH